MVVSEDRSAGLALAFEQGERAVLEQARNLEGLRSRTGLLFSAAAVMGGVLSGLALRDRPELTGGGWLAVLTGGAAFAVVLASTVAVWWPMDMNVNHDPWTIVEDYVDAEQPATLAEIHQWLAYHRHSDIGTNKAGLDRRTTWLMAGLCALPVELVALLVAVAAAAR